MEFYKAHGSTAVARRIRSAAERGALSHALLLTGSGDRLSAARYAAAAMECMEENRPCGQCAACRKVAEDIHPDVVTVKDPEHKNVAVEIIREVRADAYIRPNEGARKVYIFPDCALLTEQDQNVLLKIVEDGPAYAAFVFCADHPAQVLQTLRSRCVEWKLQPADGESDSGVNEAAAALCRAMAGGRRGAVTEAAVRLEKKKTDREAVAAMLERCRELFAEALLVLYGQAAKDREIVPLLAKNLTKGQIMSTIDVLQKYRGECAYNVGSGHVLGALAAELEGIL